jgi:hypothetical protein
MLQKQARPYCVPGWWRSCGVAKIAKKNIFKKIINIQLLKIVYYAYFRPLCKFT